MKTLPPAFKTRLILCINLMKSKWWIALKEKMQSIDLSARGTLSASDLIVLNVVIPAARK
ncbi:MAG: hypothetical protein DDT27_01628 [Dehalococcoidia bacterium]|nr:hypothetical protein [Chloroflexota bacterium]